MPYPLKVNSELEGSTDTPHISVIICTYNRSGYLRKAIHSIIVQTYAMNRYEIVIVDNNSMDDTRQVVVDEFSQYSNIKYIFEASPGLSKARNTGCTYARGMLLVFLDDDAIASQDWIENICKVYIDHPDASIVGGKIDLEWEIGRPHWMHDDLLGYLGKLEYGLEVQPIHLPERLGGGNFSIRKDILDEVGYFSSILGRGHKGLLSSEEVELLKRVQQRGGACYYTPFAVVHHYVPGNRLKKSYIRQRSYWQGYSDSIMRHLGIKLKAVDNLFAVIQWCFWTAVRSAAWLILYPFGNPANRFRRLCMIWAVWGALRHELAHLFRACNCWDIA